MPAEELYVSHPDGELDDGVLNTVDLGLSVMTYIAIEKLLVSEDQKDVSF